MAKGGKGISREMGMGREKLGKRYGNGDLYLCNTANSNTTMLHNRREQERGAHRGRREEDRDGGGLSSSPDTLSCGLHAATHTFPFSYLTPSFDH